MSAAVGLFYDPLRGADGPVPRERPWLLWRKAIRFRANPRGADYMRALFAERYPDAKFVEVSREAEWWRAAEGAREIVFLYPDSIGLGFLPLERRVRELAPAARLSALNGRRRTYRLDTRIRRALRLRRFLEWTMLIEFGLGAALLTATPFLLAYDLARGRR